MWYTIQLKFTVYIPQGRERKSYYKHYKTAERNFCGNLWSEMLLTIYTLHQNNKVLLHRFRDISKHIKPHPSYIKTIF